MPPIKVHHTATEDSAWDGPAAVAAMPNDETTLHYCHAWQDDDAGNEKSGYKMPHHRKDGGAANIPACRNGLARLPQSNIPEADHAGVKAHLQAHLDDFNEKDDGGDSEDRTAGPIVAMRFHGEKGIDITNLAGSSGWQRAVQLGQMTDDQRISAHLPRAKRLSNGTDWMRIQDYTDGTPARLDIYDEIGWSWFDEGVTAASFNKQLQSIQAPSIELHINSPGGDVFDGLAILNLLRSYGKPVDVIVDGLAASAASFIAQAGDTVTMMPNSQMMIHDASGICFGNAADMAEMGELLDHMSQNIADVYAMRSGSPADEWRTAMKAETWYSADEAVAAGLADKVGAVQRGEKKPDPEPAATTAQWNLSFYAYSGREGAPPPVIPVTPLTPLATVTAELVQDTVRGIDPEALRASILGALHSNEQEARR